MKFANVLSLLKQLGSLKVFPRLILVVHAEREERKRLVGKIGQSLANLSQSVVVRFDGEWGEVRHALLTPSFIEEKEIVTWDPVKQPLSAEVYASLEKYCLRAEDSPAFFLLGLEPSKEMAKLLETGEKVGWVLDGSAEKPWDKEKRLQQELLAMVKEGGKTLSAAAAERLLWGVGSNALLLENELLKMITFVGDRKEITEKDVLTIATPSPAQTGWQQAENLIWEGKLSVHDVDVSFLLALLGQVRFLLQQARQVFWLLEEKKEVGEIMQKLNLKSVPMQKLLDRVRQRKPGYFDRALQLVYEGELLLKNSNHSPAFILDVLNLKFTSIK